MNQIDGKWNNQQAGSVIFSPDIVWWVIHVFSVAVLIERIEAVQELTNRKYMFLKTYIYAGH